MSATNPSQPFHDGGPEGDPPDASTRDQDRLAQLFSDHLDGRLPESVRVDLERRLQDDAAAAQQWERLLGDREMLRSLFALEQESPSAQASPRGDLAARIVAEAQRRAEDERLPSAHPLRRMTDRRSGRERDQQSVRLPATGSLLDWSRVGAIAGIAASVMLVAGAAWWTQNANDQLARQSRSDQAASNQAAGDDPNPRHADLDVGIVGPVDPVEAANAGQDMMARAIEEVASEISPEIEPSASQLADARDTGPTDSARALGAAVSQEAMASIAGAVLVYDVQLTERGRAEQAVRRAMVQAGLAATSEQTISPEIVGVAQRAGALADADDFRILYLQAPAKQLDRLFLQLIEDREGVAGVGMTLAVDAPVRKLALDLRQVDPTQVRQPAVSWELTAEDRGSLAGLRGVLEEQAYVPLSSNALVGIGDRQGSPAAGGKASEISSGTDVLSQILVLVR